MNRINPKHLESLYRPVFEMNSVAIWGCAVAASLAQSMITNGVTYNLNIISSGVALGLGAYKMKLAVPRVKRQMLLMTNKMEFLSVTELRVRNKSEINRLLPGTTGPDGKEVIHDDNDKVTYKNRQTYLCDGFEWGSEHANRAYQVLDMSSDMSEIKFPLVMRPWEKNLKEQTRKLGGKPWVHGMGDSKPIYMTEDVWYGHTFITGSVGTGKTTLFKLLSLSMYHLGNVLIIVDPKNDNDWRDSIKAEMEENGEGHKFYYFNPSNPSISVRIDPLKNYNRVQELTTRIASLQATDGGSNTFTEFGWEVINKVIVACVFVGEHPTLVSIKRYLTDGKGDLALRCIKKHFNEVLDDSWEKTHARNIAGSEGKSELEKLMSYYREKVMGQHQNQAVDGAISMVEHDAAHYQKMVIGLLPLFSILNAAPFDELLSPHRDVYDDDIEDFQDPSFRRDSTDNKGKMPIINLNQVVAQGGVFYMSLDSLSDSKTAGYLAKLITQDMAAVAGDRYNHAGQHKPRRISLFVDEVHAAVAGNDALLNLLAQGRAASIQCFLASQSIADLEEKIGPAAAQRFLGLCNNFVSMRVNDATTQKFVSGQFGQTGITEQSVMSSQGSSSDAPLDEFTGSFAQKLGSIREDMFPDQLLTDLPKLQFIGRFQDGRKIKGRIPVILGDK